MRRWGISASWGSGLTGVAGGEPSRTELELAREERAREGRRRRRGARAGAQIGVGARPVLALAVGDAWWHGGVRCEKLAHLVAAPVEVFTRYSERVEELGDGRHLGVCHWAVRVLGGVGAGADMCSGGSVAPRALARAAAKKRR